MELFRRAVRKDHLLVQSDKTIPIEKITGWTDEQKNQYAWAVYNSTKAKYTQAHKEGAIEFLRRQFGIAELFREEIEREIREKMTLSTEYTIDPTQERQQEMASSVKTASVAMSAPAIEETAVITPSPKTTITVFQALTILAKKYRGDEAHKETYAQIKSLYLSGVKQQNDVETLERLFQNDALKGFNISKEAHDINEDPVRRYFESRLCNETLKDSLDRLDLRRLERHFNSIYSLMSSKRQKGFDDKISNGTVETDGIEKEYAEGVRVLKDPASFQSLKPEEGTKRKTPEQILADRKQKMIFLGKSALAALRTGVSNLPLDLYHNEDYVYGPANRGRVPRKDEDGNDNSHVRGFNLGIMRTYMPVPQGDALQSPELAGYDRPVDGNTFVPGAQMPEKFFSTQVSPFVSSISGTMLGQLRVTAKLMQEKKYLYEAQGKDADAIEAQLKEYFRSFVAYMIYNAGGHSLNEFLSVLELPEIKDAFKDLPGFDKLNLEQLFKEENDAAFERAVDATIEYNEVIVHKKEAHDELLAVKPVRPLDSNVDELTQIVRSRLRQIKADPISKAERDLQMERDIEKNFKIHQDRETSKEDKQAASKELGKLLYISVKEPIDYRALDKKIMSRMSQRAEDFRISLYSSLEGTLATRLDKAWAAYQDDNKPAEVSMYAQSFLIDALDIKFDDIPEDKNLNELLVQMMQQREMLKAVNPDFIPGRSPTSLDAARIGGLQQTGLSGEVADLEIQSAIKNKELLDVNKNSKKKDRGETTGKKTIFLTDLEREQYRVAIREGQFVQHRAPFSTSDSISHGKKGFSAFTLNVHGELSVFPHIDHDTTGIAHSSMNRGKPVVSAGEVKIENGKLISITDHSGHYRPTAYSLYRALDYFRKQGVDVSDVKVYMMPDPSKKMDVKTQIEKFKGPPDKTFYVSKASDFFFSYTKKFTDSLTNIKKDLEEYQKPNWGTTLSLFKDWLTRSTVTSDGLKLAERLSADLIKKAAEINKLTSVKKIEQFCKSLEAMHAEALKKLGSKTDSRLGQKIESMRTQIAQLRAETESYKERINRGEKEENVLSDSQSLKTIGRK